MLPSRFKGLGHDFAPTAVAVVNQPLSTENDALLARRFEPQNNVYVICDEATFICRRGKDAPIPFDKAFTRPAPMLSSTPQNAPTVGQMRLRRLVARRGGMRAVCLKVNQNCVPGTHTRPHFDAALRVPPAGAPRQNPRP